MHQVVVHNRVGPWHLQGNCSRIPYRYLFLCIIHDWPSQDFWLCPESLRPPSSRVGICLELNPCHGSIGPDLYRILNDACLLQICQLSDRSVTFCSTECLSKCAEGCIMSLFARSFTACVPHSQPTGCCFWNQKFPGSSNLIQALWLFMERWSRHIWHKTSKSVSIVLQKQKEQSSCREPIPLCKWRGSIWEAKQGTIGWKKICLPTKFQRIRNPAAFL